MNAPLFIDDTPAISIGDVRAKARRKKRDENIQDSKVIRAYHKDLDKRENEALKAGRPFPKVLYLALYRPTELSLQFIRWMRSCLIRSTPYKQALLLLRPLMDAYI